MRSKVVLAPALIAVALALSACGGGDDETTESAPATEATTDETPATEATTDETPATEATTTEEGGSTPTPGGEARRAEKVKIVEFTYQPDPVTVQAGGKVVWQNEDTAPHTATADDGSFDTGTIEQGKLGSATFKEAGSYPYFCEIHPDMRGTVEVVE